MEVFMDGDDDEEETADTDTNWDSFFNDEAEGDE